jgi:uncharacterized protein YggT (Ycf19 family)
MNPLLQYWHFHLPNFVLAAIMYTLLGRLILSFMAPPNWQNYIWRAFVRITEPAVRLTRFVTPEVLPPIVVMIFAILWLMVLRVALFVGFANAGLLPPVGGA